MIEFNGIKSEAVGLRLLGKAEFSQAQRDITEVVVPGRDGIVLISNERLDKINQNFSFRLKRIGSNTLEQQMQVVKEWLDKPKGAFTSFLWAADELYQYQGRFISTTYSRENNVFMAVDITFQFQPIKLLKAGLNPVTVTTGSTLKNIGKVVSNPVITLTGTGNITLTINAKSYVFKNISGGIVIDSENEVVTSLDGYQPQWDKAYTWPLPVLGLGDNEISWDNSAFKVSIMPRWGVLV
ncbi:hypothetical protein [Pseudolactococcus piscium]|uniref:Prophage pi2 protein 43 n=1 Tax=Pseudolactococcus piscium MKFS47 TaxID=297352 RepID=A0A0D6DW38_9LACT|nr:hypothetical protein [Lactococcus piscium]CEN27972.1 Prophage pi2 protein 43 [Lactococcus piscium MKFS47]